MNPRKTMTHHQSRRDANHLIRQHARRAALPAHTPFVSRATRLSTYVVPNVNGTIRSQWSYVNAVRLLPDQREESQISIEPIQKEIYPV
jgi:hypothetical protein